MLAKPWFVTGCGVGFVTMQPRREVRTMLSVFVVAVRVQTVCVAAMTPLIIRVCSTEIEREGGGVLGL
jgi:hypothetical protein